MKRGLASTASTIAFNPANLTDPTSVGIGDGLSGKVGSAADHILRYRP